MRANKRVRFIDLHNDAITVLTAACFKKYIKRAKKDGAEVIFVSVWTTEMQDPMQRIRDFMQMIDGISGEVSLYPKLLLHIEDAWFVNEQNIDEFLRCKPFSVGLTWNTGNALAGGAYSEEGLTQLGHSIVNRLDANGVVIDLAHLNRCSFFQVAEELLKNGRKLFCSHTCFDGVNAHRRNLERRQIQTIADSGGLIGLTLVGDFLNSGSAAQEDVYAHIAYFIDNFGDDNLAIGTDFYGTVNLPQGILGYKDFKRFKKFSIKKGLKAESLDKIFFGNAEKFLTSYIYKE